MVDKTVYKYFNKILHLSVQLVALLMLPIVTFTGILSIETRSNNVRLTLY